MAKNNKEYWRERFEEVLISNEKLALEYEKEMGQIYEQVKQDLQKEMESFYARYAKETGLDLADVRTRLNPEQLKRFKTQQSIYLKEVQKLIKQGMPLQQYADKLKELSARAYVTKLQELQNNLNTQITILTGKQELKLSQTMQSSYLQGYYKSSFALQQGVGFGYSFTVPNTDDVQKVLKTPWNGNNYSKSIWTNKAKLTNWLNTDLARHFAAGSSVQQMSADLVKKVDTNYKSAIRLVRTEVNYISNQSTMDAYEAHNVDKYEILATLDSRTSDICRDMDGRVFNTTEKKVAVNMPPFHVNCRTTTIPYFEDDDLEDVERAARDSNGKYYTVPADMDYQEWNDKYGQGAKVKQGKTVTGPEDTIPVDQSSGPVTVEKANVVKGSEIPQQRNYEAFTQDEIDDWQKTNVDKLDKNSADYDAIRDYTGTGSDTINMYLRGMNSLGSPETIAKSNLIAKNMDIMPKDSILYRAVNGDAIPKMIANKELSDRLFELIKPIYRSVDNVDLQTLRKMLINQTLTDKAFMSTGWKPGTYKRRDVELRIKTNKGTKALPVENISYHGKEITNYGGANEHEVILDKNTSIRVDDVFIEDGKLILETTASQV